MKQQHLKILRYNTGTDKKAFVQFKDFFDAAIFNATIVAYSGASVADLISMHSRRYIIDPQTHIFQQELSAYTTENKKTHIPAIKKSVTKYLEKRFNFINNVILKSFGVQHICGFDDTRTLRISKYILVEDLRHVR